MAKSASRYAPCSASLSLSLSFPSASLPFPSARKSARAPPRFAALYTRAPFPWRPLARENMCPRRSRFCTSRERTRTMSLKPPRSAGDQCWAWSRSSSRCRANCCPARLRVLPTGPALVLARCLQVMSMLSDPNHDSPAYNTPRLPPFLLVLPPGASRALTRSVAVPGNAWAQEHRRCRHDAR